MHIKAIGLQRITLSATYFHRPATASNARVKKLAMLLEILPLA